MSLHEMPELSSCLSGSDATTLLEIIHGSLACGSEEEFAALFPKIRELFPFDFAGVVLGRIDDGHALVLTNGLNISFPEEWLRTYLSKNYFHNDVLTRETLRICKPQHWSYLKPGSEIVPKDIKSLNMDIGAREAFSHGLKPPGRRQNGSGFCFAGPSMRDDERTAAVLEFLVPHLHLALSHIFRDKPPNINNPVLSAREMEVLNWLKQGKSSWDMSVILGISESTVNFHVYNIMRKLDALNRPQAVAVATRLGLIDI